MKRIAIEFDGKATDARALARAVAYVFEASRVSGGFTYIDGVGVKRPRPRLAGGAVVGVVTGCSAW